MALGDELLQRVGWRQVGGEPQRLVHDEQRRAGEQKYCTFWVYISVCGFLGVVHQVKRSLLPPFGCASSLGDAQRFRRKLEKYVARDGGYILFQFEPWLSELSELSALS